MSKLLRQGHAPGHLREAFQAFLDDEWKDDPLPKTVDVGGDEKPLRWLLGQLWHCTDTLPGTYGFELGLEGRNTYAAAVRKVADEIKNEG